jgi:hypothetical protein
VWRGCYEGYAVFENFAGQKNSHLSHRSSIATNHFLIRTLTTKSFNAARVLSLGIAVVTQTTSEKQHAD